MQSDLGAILESPVAHIILSAAVGALVAMISAALSDKRRWTRSRSAGNVGASGHWVLASICFAGMRAQNSPRAGWRIVAFLFGFPGTLVTYFVPAEGSERAYGIEISRKR